MPDLDGWEIQPRHRDTIWHADCDQQVENTPDAKRLHLKECRRAQAQAAKAAESERRAIQMGALRTVNRERRLASRVLGARA